MRCSALLGLLIACFTCTHAQTVGVLEHDVARAYKGYTLIAPVVSTMTYLIDNDGQVVRTWQSQYRAGQAAMLLDGGSLLRTGTPAGNLPLNGGGSGGIVERFGWDGQLLWTYNLYGPNGRAHHDVEIMPNGNVLLLVWYPIPRDTALALGRLSSRLRDQTMWLERIIEVKPTGPTSGEIVWTWDTRNNLVQNADPSLPNYGVIAEHPDRIDINAGGDRTDWLHLNSLRYNADRDEVMVSVHNLNEFWVISRKTGKIVYRYGNPQIYGRGNVAAQTLWGQHDARWITAGLAGAGNFMVFNNGTGRPGTARYSTVEELTPPLDESGQYVLEKGAAFGPVAPAWMFTPPAGNTAFFAANISGATRLPNGNTLVCYGPQGMLAEVTNDGDIVWRYVSPVGMNGTVRQGQIPQNSMIFKVYRYGADHPAVAGRSLTPRGRLEDGPLSVSNAEPVSSLRIAYAPGAEQAMITVTAETDTQLDAFNVLGQWLGTVHDGPLTVGTHTVDVPAGALLIRQTR
ncbi:MAG: arylsulfotransferase [Candidatus Kapabacteria bacterium]|nr:arylsulfotransferase [Candidatus Kapabacteria bacterium]